MATTRNKAQHGRAPAGPSGAGTATADRAAPAERTDGHISIDLPHLGVPHLNLSEVGHTMDRAVGALRSHQPATGRWIFYGGLGLAVATGIVDLPVGLAIGAGVWVATRNRPPAQDTGRTGHPASGGAQPAGSPDGGRH